MKTKSEEEIYFTPKQASQCFNLSLSTVKNYIYAKKLKTLKTPGGHHRIRKSDLLATLGERKFEGKGDAYDGALKGSLCNALIVLFKVFGPVGNSLLMHAKEVSALSSNIARAMSMSDSEIEQAKLAGLVHDLGHMAVDRYILLKDGVLNAQEYESIKVHPRMGRELLGSVKWLEDLADIVVQHHERIDGKGYPRGLRGKDIKRAARIISIAEAYDSMVSDYSYKRPISKQMAIDELIHNSDSQFDSDIVKIFIKTI